MNSIFKLLIVQFAFFVLVKCFHSKRNFLNSEVLIDIGILSLNKFIILKSLHLKIFKILRSS